MQPQLGSSAAQSLPAGSQKDNNHGVHSTHPRHFSCYRISRNAHGLDAGFYKQARDIFYWVESARGLPASQLQRGRWDLSECGCVKITPCIPKSEIATGKVSKQALVELLFFIYIFTIGFAQLYYV